MRVEPGSTPIQALLGLVCLIAAMPLACARTTTSNVAVGEVWEDERGEVLEKDYVIKDKLLAKEIEVVDVKARYVGDFLEGLAIVKNRRKYTVDFEYRFEWYDETGFPVESNVVHWTPDLLYGKESKWIKALCPKPGATGFKVMIRLPNPVEE
jgi:uncharacterized protein YcfL